MQRYISIQDPNKTIFDITDTSQLSRLLRDLDIRPTRDLVELLHSYDGNPQVYLGGGVVDSWKNGEKSYGDIDLVAVYSEETHRLNTLRRLNNLQATIMRPSLHGLNQIVIPIFSTGKSNYLITKEDQIRMYMNINIDERFLFEPVRISPTIGIVPFGSPIDLSLASQKSFNKFYQKAE